MLESIESLLEGVTLVDMVEWFTKTYFSWSEFIKENIVLNHRILCSKARCRNLSHRNLILETENADLNLSNCLNGKDFARSFGVGVE